MSDVDSKHVSKALTRDVFPLLREAGFDTFKGRTAWRETEDVIGVVSFGSMGSYLAERIGVTSHSFGGTVGVYYKAVHAAPWADQPAPHHPEEPACHARRVLRKSMFQLWCWRPDVWYVDRSGKNLDRVTADVRRAVRDQALPWLAEFSDIATALAAVEKRKDSEMRPGIMLEGLGGAIDSYARA